MKCGPHGRPPTALGDPQTIENAILSFEPRRMLSIRVSRSPDGFPFLHAIGNMWTVLYFEAVSPNQTRLRLVGLGFSANDESQKMLAFFERGNASTLAQLQEHFASRR
jgi:hypothetical protein